MEYTQWVGILVSWFNTYYDVLILVVMEYTQWENNRFGDIFDEES